MSFWSKLSKMFNDLFNKHPFTNEQEKAILKHEKELLMEITDEDMHVAIATVYGEAEAETMEGKIAVACVIRNRVNKDLHGDDKSDWWGEGVAEVCLKKWQFSCWNEDEGNHRLEKLKEMAKATPEMLMKHAPDKNYQEASNAVLEVFKRDIKDITNGADHYYADYIQAPKWSKGKEPTLVLGRHLFFRLED